MVTLKRPAQAPTTASGEPVISRPAASTTKGAVKSPLPGVILQVNCKVGDTVKERPESTCPRSHEDGKPTSTPTVTAKSLK